MGHTDVALKGLLHAPYPSAWESGSSFPQALATIEAELKYLGRYSSSGYTTLMLAACDWYFESKRARMGDLLNHTNVSRHLVQPRYGCCSRCTMSYLVSQDGAKKLLDTLSSVESVGLGPDWYINHAGEGKYGTASTDFNCLWAEAPIMREDPGKGGDGVDQILRSKGRLRMETGDDASGVCYGLLHQVKIKRRNGFGSPSRRLPRVNSIRLD